MTSVQREAEDLIISMLNAESMGFRRPENERDLSSYPVLKEKEYSHRLIEVERIPPLQIEAPSRLKLPVQHEFSPIPQTSEGTDLSIVKEAEIENLRKELQELNARYEEVIRSENQVEIDEENAYLQLDKMTTNDESEKSSIDLLLTEKMKIIADFETQRDNFKEREVELLKRIEELDSRCNELLISRRELGIEVESTNATAKNRLAELIELRKNSKEEFDLMEEQNHVLSTTLLDYQHIIENYQNLIASFDFQQYEKQIYELIYNLREIAREQVNLEDTIENLQTADIFDIIFETFDETKGNLLASNRTTILAHQLKDVEFEYAELKGEHDLMFTSMEESEELSNSFKKEVGKELHERTMQLTSCQERFEQEIEALKAEIELLNEENEAKAEELKILKDLSSKETEKLRAEILEVEQQKLKLQESFFVETQQMRDSTTNQQEEIIELRNTAHLAVAETERIRVQMEQTILALEAQVVSLEEESDQKAVSSEEARQLLEKEVENSAEAESDLRHQCVELEDQVSRMNEHLLAAKNEIKERDETIETVEAKALEEMAAAEEHIDELKDQIVHLEREMNTVSAGNKETSLRMTQNETMLNEKILGLESELEQKDGIVEEQYIREQELNRANLELVAANKALNAELLALQNEISEHGDAMQQVVVEFTSQLEEREAALLEAEDSERQSDADNERKIEALKLENDRLQSRTSSQEMEINSIKENALLSSKNLSDELAESERNLMEAQQELQNARLEMTTERAELNHRASEVAVDTSVVNELREELERLEEELNSKDAQVQGLAAELRAILNESEEIGADVDTEIAQFQAELAEKAAQLQQEENAFNEYKTRTKDAAQLVEECKLETEMISSLEDTNKSIGEENKELRRENDGLKNANKNLRDALNSDDIEREVKARYAELLNSMQQ